MADWNNSNSQMEGQQLSKFNAALFQMERIHKLQQNINFCSGNPLLFNGELNTYNYNIWFESLNSLFVKDVKEFIKETIKDTQHTFNFSRKKCEFLERLEKRAGDKLKW